MKPVSRRSVLAGMTGAGLALGGCAEAQTRKIDLWDNAAGPFLRGAVLAQRRVFPQIDGPDFMGPGPVGVPVSDAALAGLSRRGANLLVLSHPGTHTVEPPYYPDPAVEDHLNDLIRRCEMAGLYVVIGFRTGPGRSAFTFNRDDAGDWFPAEMIDETVWQSSEAQDGWDSMWRRTAQRFRNRPNVAGYLLMVEPNANQAAPGPDGGDLDEWDPQRLADHVAGTPADWPALALRLARAIREHDTETPILMSPDGYAHRRFETLLDLNAVPGTVLAIHDYTPRDYTHQGRSAGIDFNRADAVIEPPAAERWMLGEFGVARWAPNASRFINTRVASLERAGAGWAFYRWDTGWRVYEDRQNSLNPLYGTDPDSTVPDERAPLAAQLQTLWSRNWARPAPFLRR